MKENFEKKVCRQCPFTICTDIKEGARSKFKKKPWPVWNYISGAKVNVKDCLKRKDEQSDLYKEKW